MHRWDSLINHDGKCAKVYDAANQSQSRKNKSKSPKFNGRTLIFDGKEQIPNDMIQTSISKVKR